MIENPITPQQLECLRQFASKALGWERAVNFPGIVRETWDAFVASGLVEEHLSGPTVQDRYMRITEKGQHVVETT